MAPSQPHPATQRAVRKLYSSLRRNANYIEHKFRQRNADDIDPSYIEDILENVVTAQGLQDELGIHSRDLDALEFTCYEALKHHKNKDYARYFEVLKLKILPLLKNV